LPKNPAKAVEIVQINQRRKMVPPDHPAMQRGRAWLPAPNAVISGV
jgi:hypothetical protein